MESKVFSFKEIVEQVAELSIQANRKPESIQILPVSKGQKLITVKDFLLENPSVSCLGENYLEEMCGKQEALKTFKKLSWHYLGRLQSRKISEIAQGVDVIHSISRRKELELLSKMELKESLQFYLQFNVSEEASKGGFRIDEASSIADLVEGFGLGERVLGLMTLVSPIKKVGEKIVEGEFAALCQIRDVVFPNKGLSMGMSSDFHLAIKHGATCLRLGSILFGERQ